MTFPNINSFDLWKDSEDYILNSLPFCHNLNKDPLYTIQDCINMPYVKGIYYLSFYTDREIINYLGISNKLYGYNKKLGRLQLLRSYFMDLTDEYIDDIPIPRKGDYSINEFFRKKYVERAQPFWDINLDQETKNIIHVSWNKFYNSLALCTVIANFYASYRKLRIEQVIKHISKTYKG